MKKVSSVVAMALFVAAANHIAGAADGTWTNLTDGQLWSVAGNWQDGVVADGTDATAAFNTLDITADTTVHLDAPRTVGNLVFGDTVTNSAVGWTLDNNGNGANVLTLAGVVPTISVGMLGAGKRAAISAGIAGEDGLDKTGPGTLELSGMTSYTGDTSIEAGKLSVSSSLSSNGVLNIAGDATLEYTVPSGELPQRKTRVTGTGTLLKTGSGTAYFGKIVGNRIDWALGEGGWIDVQQGTLYGGGFNNGYWTENMGSLHIAAGATFQALEAQVYVDQLTGSGTLMAGYQTSGAIRVGINQSSSTFDGSIINTVIAGVNSRGQLIKQGSGVFTLTGSNTYTGNTTVAGGTLAVSGRLYAVAAPVPVANATVSVQNDATLELGTWGCGSGESLGLLASSAGCVALGNNSRVRLTGTSVSRRAATVSPGAVATLESADGAHWEILSAESPWSFGAGASLTLAGAGDGRLANGFSGSRGIEKTGGGNWTLAGTNTFNGPIRVQSGVLRVAASEDDNSIDFLGLWLDATRGVVTNTAGHVIKWTDLSGNGRHATSTNGPIVMADINSHPSLRFTRTQSQYLEGFGLRNLTNLTIFVVHKLATFPSDFFTLLAEDSISSNAYGCAIHYNVKSNKQIEYYVSGSTPASIAFTTAAVTSKAQIYEILDNNGVCQFFMDGVADGGGTRTAHWKRLNDFRIGAWNNSRYYDGSIGELLVYEKALSDAERAQVYSYLNGKWMIPGGGVPSITNIIASDAVVTVDTGATVDFGGQGQTFAVLQGNGLVTNGAATATLAIAPGGTNQIGTLTVAQVTLAGHLVIDADVGASDHLDVIGDLDLSRVDLQLAATATPGIFKQYAIATCTGELIAPFASVNLPGAWHIRYTGQQVLLICRTGTMISVH